MKLLVISDDTHKNFKEWCARNKVKMKPTIEELIRGLIELEVRGNDEQTESNI